MPNLHGSDRGTVYGGSVCAGNCRFPPARRPLGLGIAPRGRKGRDSCFRRNDGRRGRVMQGLPGGLMFVGGITKPLAD